MASVSERTSILLVDDHPANLLALEATLAPLGQRLVRATSGAEALRHLLEEEFACIVLDVQMPELDGFETAKLIKARERSRHTPLLFLTAVYREPSSVLQGYALGAVDYILKPVDPDILRTKVAVFVDLHLQLLRMRELRGQVPDAERSLRARESLRRLHAALEVLRAESAPLPALEAAVAAAPVGLGLLDPQLRYLRLNAALAALHGLHVEEAPGRSLWALAPELADLANAWLHERRGSLALSGRVVSQALRAGPGHWRHLLCSLVRGPEGVELAAVDLTLQHEAVQLLHSAIRQLAAAGEALFLPLDPADAPRRIAQRVVERVSDGCLVDLLDEAGHLEPAALAHVRPEREPLLRELRAGQGPGLLSSARLRSLDERRSQLVRPSPEELLARAGDQESQSRLLRALGPQAAFVVTPLRMGSRTYGTLTFLCDGATYAFGDEELNLLEEVAAHAALALDHARLFREAQALLQGREAHAAPLHLSLQERLHALQRQLQELAHAGFARQGVAGALEEMGRQVQQAALLLDRLLELSQACARQLRRELAPVDLREVVGERLAQAQRAEPVAGEPMELDAPEPVRGQWDRAQLEDVVGSVLEHALQQGCGSPLHVEVSTHAGLAHLVVRDEGIGIAPEDAQRLCGTLATGPAVSALARAREAITSLGGSLAVHSAPGRGSTVLLTLPLHPAA